MDPSSSRKICPEWAPRSSHTGHIPPSLLCHGHSIWGCYYQGGCVYKRFSMHWYGQLPFVKIQDMASAVDLVCLFLVSSNHLVYWNTIQSSNKLQPPKNVYRLESVYLVQFGKTLFFVTRNNVLGWITFGSDFFTVTCMSLKNVS